MSSLHPFFRAGAACLLLASTTTALAGAPLDNRPLSNAAGKAASYSSRGAIDRGNEFFRDLGGNGRSCVSCHQPAEGWSVAPAGIHRRFRATAGRDPIFRTNDGSNTPAAAVGTRRERRAAYSLLLNKGLFRIGLKIPADAEFELLEALDPYGYISSSMAAPELSLFRRPLPATNLKFASTVMWDARESDPTGTISANLAHQANSATTGHAQGEALNDIQRRHIVDFETALFTTQIYDRGAKALSRAKSKAGPRGLARQDFAPGINAPFVDGEPNPQFDSRVFTLYDSWLGRPDPRGDDDRAAIARGQEIFNSRSFIIRNVGGLNDDPRSGHRAEITGTCGTCHNAPAVGSSSQTLVLNTGLSDANRRSIDLPLYSLRNKATGEIMTTSDPGRAMISGKWTDIGRFKVPALRALAARPPYFHNGAAATLSDVVDFYEGRFGLGLSNRDRLDLIRFLEAL
ncbi:MAG: hypothetical protein FIA97_16410 [Methylococcaceae bacterium]|nr:hypothetical protein [Methylococcaceae bacterium]